jgi:glycosyltransferase involved in cell wall biosynthesis
MPNVIMEAMARGLAIMTTPVGAITSVVDENNGWFVMPGDVNSLQRCLSAVLQLSSDEIAEKQMSSLTRIKQFTWEDVARLTIKKISQFTSAAS